MPAIDANIDRTRRPDLSTEASVRDFAGILGDDHAGPPDFDGLEPGPERASRPGSVPSEYSRDPPRMSTNGRRPRPGPRRDFSPRPPTLSLRAGKSRRSSERSSGQGRHGLSHAGACVEDLRRTGRLVAIESEGRPEPGGRRHPAQGLRGGRPGGPVLPQGQGGPPSRWSATSSARWTGCTTSSATPSRRSATSSSSRSSPPPPSPTPGAIATSRSRRCTSCPGGSAAGRSWPTGRRLSQLPQLQSWPDDGGAFVTLPQVYSEDPDRPGLARSNLGMYRVQYSGNQATSPTARPASTTRSTGGSAFTTRRRSAAVSRSGPASSSAARPALTVAAVMPLPEGLPELSFAGALGGHRIRMVPRPARRPPPARRGRLRHRRHHRPRRPQARRAFRRPPWLLQP